MTELLLDRAQRFLRGHTVGELRFDDQLQPCTFVIEPKGRLVASVPVLVIDAVETILFVPDYGDRAMELLVTVEAMDENGPHGGHTDRWRIYHGQPQEPRWAFFDIETARFDGQIIDGPQLHRENQLCQAEARLCKEMNLEHRDDLRRLCEHFCGCDVQLPTMVGIDPWGIDVRRQLDVVRVPFAVPPQCPESARTALREMAREAEG